MDIHVANYFINAHIIYKDLFVNCPDKITYKKTFPLFYYFKKKLLGYKKAAIELSSHKYSFIHSFGQLLSTKKPWIATIEHPFIFSERDYNYLKNGVYKEYLRKLVKRDNCKALIGLTKKAAKSLDEYFDDVQISKKIIYIYPSIKFKTIFKPKIIHKKVVKLLFIANNDFYLKGGSEVLKAFQILDRKYPTKFRLIFKCGVIPKDMKISDELNNVEFIQKRLDYSSIQNLFKTSDIFLSPMFKSGFAVFLEAMNAGLPIITLGCFDIPEIIVHNRNGIVIPTNIGLLDNLSKYRDDSAYIDYLKKRNNNKIIDSLVRSVEKLSSNPNMYHNISKNNIYDIQKGRFSYKKRNNAYKNIYTSLNE